MTPAKIWTILRWPIAIVGLLFLANYAYPRFLDTLPTMVEFDASGSILAPESETETAAPIVIEPTVEPTLEAGTGPVVDGSSTPVADFFLDRTAADIDNEQLILSDDPADGVVIAFDIPAGDPSCMTSMTLSMTVEEVASTTELGIYASSVSDAATLVDNEQVDSELRATPTPMATRLVEQAGRIDLDVLAGYQSYFLLGLPPTSPFVVAVLPTVPIETQGGVRIASANQEDDDVPTLAWTADPNCTGV